MTVQVVGMVASEVIGVALRDPELRKAATDHGYVTALNTGAVVSGVIAGGLENAAATMRRHETNLKQRAESAKRDGYSSAHFQETLRVIRECR